MKLFLLVLILLTLASCKRQVVSVDNVIETQPPTLTAHHVQVNGSIAGFYSALPAHYHETSKRYPLLIFLHGGGQTGNGGTELQRVLGEGVPLLVREKVFPAHFQVNGTYFSFIILAPQFNEMPKPATVLSFLSYAKQHFRVDTSRVYLSGFSSGGVATSDFSAEYTASVAAAVSIAGVSQWFDLENKARKIAEGQLPLWIFHNEGDLVIPMNDVQHFVDLINSNHPLIPPKFTQLLPFGIFNHDAWTRVTDPACRVDGMNMYEWMLQYSR